MRPQNPYVGHFSELEEIASCSNLPKLALPAKFSQRSLLTLAHERQSKGLQQENHSPVSASQPEILTKKKKKNCRQSNRIQKTHLGLQNPRGPTNHEVKWSRMIGRFYLRWCSPLQWQPQRWDQHCSSCFHPPFARARHRDFFVLTTGKE
jgi:hypothetical protein